MATIVADDALAEAAGSPIDVDVLEIKLTAFLQVDVAKNQERKRKRVATAVVKNGGRSRVCRAYCHGQCLLKCPFGLDHVNRRR